MLPLIKMNHFRLDYFVSLVMMLTSNIVQISSNDEVQSRSLDLSWRPLSHNPYHKQLFQTPPAALISYSHFDKANKDEIVEAAKHNAQLLKKLKEINHQPITSYSDPYQMYTNTEASTRFPSTTQLFTTKPLKHQHQSAASAHVLSRIPFPGKSVSLYQTKLNYLGKPDSNAVYHQNSIHQTIPTTPKIAGYTKEHGRVNFHFHHPSYAMTQISTTTKRVPIFSSSATPHPHPVMNKYQAHMALAAASQKQHHQLKQQQNVVFSPPSQIMSSYANLAQFPVNHPFWHMGVKSAPYHIIHENREFPFHFHKLPEPQHHQQIIQYQQKHPQPPPQQYQQPQVDEQPFMPSIHPSILTPFLEQVQLKQKEAAEQKTHLKQSHEVNSQENDGSFEIINDVFSKHLVPPPPSNPSPLKIKSKPEKPDKVKKYNLSMPSPLQDASRFNYENVISTATPAAIPTEHPSRAKPTVYEHINASTEKPNVFIHLNNRTKENVYKHHKLLHPSYTGGFKKRPSHFLPTPYEPTTKEEEGEEAEKQLQKAFEPQHSFFTIEDAVTPHLRYEVIKGPIPVKEEQEIYTRAPALGGSFEYSLTTDPFISTSTSPPTEATTTHKPKQKLRRRKPKPHHKKNNNAENTSTGEGEKRIKESVKSSRVRENVKPSERPINQKDLRTRNRTNHPSRVRNRVSLTSPAAIFSTVDYETMKSSTEEQKSIEVTSTQHETTETTTNSKSEETSGAENVKRRVRVRYRNKLRAGAVTKVNEPTELKQKISDNQISDNEHENIIFKHQDDSTESNSATEAVVNEIKTSLRLPNLKLRNEAFTTLPTTQETLTTLSHSSSSKSSETDDNNILNRVANRPRFSIKEIKRKQLSALTTHSTTLTTSSTPAPSTKSDNQRFNRIRYHIRRRNETTESTEDPEPTRKRYSTYRTTTSTTESSVEPSTTSKRANLPKRTFPSRTFMKPTASVTESETSTSYKPFKSVSRPTTPNLRTRLQSSYKKKEEVSDDVTESSQDTITNVNFNLETAVTQEQPSTVSTESPYKHETSIMKIAKTPSSVNNVERTASTNSINVIPGVTDSDYDMTGLPSEHSQRVAELTISGNENYSFKSANIGPLSRRIPSYFTISTDDPILPIQAFFPQIKTNETN
ncbi:CLUMA_CG011967, isoform A [Clunio marinus]|uniref:CLUMA_CG011967, isoform A n=1 Tax=Clunio marinus TaxID=568069 RepID=A0A1J1IEZ5_9DIPT|nr:CLUMA_CG011967, isoform A [Clunio marinus]